MEKVNVLIIEDEFIIAEDIKEALEGLGYHVSGIAGSFDEAIRFMTENKPDIAIIDIKIKGSKTGIDVGLHIREKMDFPFIYLSSHVDKKTVHEATQSEPNAYLVKPFKKEELYTSIEIALSNYSNKNSDQKPNDNLEEMIINDSIFIKCDCYFTKIKLADIIYLKSDGNYIDIIVDGQKNCVIRSTLKEFKKYLNAENFIRVHHSYIINVNFIQQMTHNSIRVKDFEVPISRNKRDDIMKRLIVFS